jgi:hypothetical protein
LEQALQNDEKPRIFALAYEPISALKADIRSLLCKSLALGFAHASEERYFCQFCRSDYVVVSPR